MPHQCEFNSSITALCPDCGETGIEQPRNPVRQAFVSGIGWIEYCQKHKPSRIDEMDNGRRLELYNTFLCGAHL